MSFNLHNILQILTVLESGKRRKPRVRKALVSKPYPNKSVDVLCSLPITLSSAGLVEVVKTASNSLSPDVASATPFMLFAGFLRDNAKTGEADDTLIASSLTLLTGSLVTTVVPSGDVIEISIASLVSLAIGELREVVIPVSDNDLFEATPLTLFSGNLV